MAISVLNTDAGLSGKTIVNAEDTQTITGAKTFDRDPSAPFAVSANSAVVTNLDADKLDGIEGADLLKKDGTVALTGTLDLGTVGKVKFPAAQSASADANTLDDYEEGTWTPTITGATSASGQVYSTQQGTYVKVGQLVMAQGRVTLSTLGTITGNVCIGGLPFTASAHYGAASIGYWTGMTTSLSWLGAWVVFSSQTIELRGVAAGGAANSISLAQGDLSNTTDIMFAVTYRASA